MPRALILKFGAIGDVVMAIPGAHQLSLQGHAIDWVCGGAVLPLLQLYPWINPIPIDDRALLLGSTAVRLREAGKLWRRLAGRRYDLAATLYYDPRYRFLLLPVKATRKILLSHTDRRFRLLPGRHHTDEFARILLGWPDERRPQQLAPVSVPTAFLPSSPLPPATRPRIVLSPAGAKNMMADDKLRRWNPSLYVKLAERLLDQGTEIVLIGGPGDAWVQPLFSHLPVHDLIGHLALPQTLSLLNASDLLITHDTGPLHLGGITQVGVLGIFGPTDPRGRLPQRPGTTAIWGGEGFACRPCYDAHSFAPCPANDCMSQVTPAMVLEEARRMMHERASGTLAPPRVIAPARNASAAPLVRLGDHS